MNHQSEQVKDLKKVVKELEAQERKSQEVLWRQYTE
jgi:hypothetical protein